MPEGLELGFQRLEVIRLFGDLSSAGLLVLVKFFLFALTLVLQCRDFLLQTGRRAAATHRGEPRLFFLQGLVLSVQDVDCLVLFRDGGLQSYLGDSCQKSKRDRER